MTTKTILANEVFANFMSAQTKKKIQAREVCHEEHRSELTVNSLAITAVPSCKQRKLAASTRCSKKLCVSCCGSVGIAAVVFAFSRIPFGLAASLALWTAARSTVDNTAGLGAVSV